MKKMWKRISQVLLGLLLLSGMSGALFADSTPTTKQRAAVKTAAKKKTKLQEAEERATSAERRAQEAEAAATKAARDARAAQEQAAQAMEAARRANEALTRLQETLVRVEQSSGQTASEVASLKRADEQFSTDIKSLRASNESTTKKLNTVDKRTEGAMTSVSKLPVKIYGNILLNSSFVDRGSNTNDIPLFAQKAGTSSDQNHQNFNMTLRQTRFGIRYEGKIFDDAKLTGVFEFDLLGGKPAFANGENFDIFRLRLAYGRIDWKHDSIEGGQDWAVFSPLNPTTLASYAIPGFSTSGNLWIRSPQIRYEHRADVGQKTKLIFTGALLDPNAGDNAGNPAVRLIGLGERGSIPAVESRIGFTTSTHGKESSAGVSGHYSRLLGVPGNPAGTLVRSTIDSYGVSGDGNVWLTSGIRVSGEVFHGRALGIFSGNIAQSTVVFNGRTRGINSNGGWFEVHAETPTGYEGVLKKFSANFGYGIENNRDEDLLVGMRKRNQTYMVNGQYKFSPNFTFAVEYRQIQTDWFKQLFANQKLNWGNVAFFYTF